MTELDSSHGLVAAAAAIVPSVFALWPKIMGGKAAAEKALWDRLNAEVTRLSERCEALEKRIEERDEVIDRLTNRVQELEDENASLKRQLAKVQAAQK